MCQGGVQEERHAEGRTIRAIDAHDGKERARVPRAGGVRREEDDVPDDGDPARNGDGRATLVDLVAEPNEEEDGQERAGVDGDGKDLGAPRRVAQLRDDGRQEERERVCEVGKVAVSAKAFFASSRWRGPRYRQGLHTERHGKAVEEPAVGVDERVLEGVPCERNGVSDCCIFVQSAPACNVELGARYFCTKHAGEETHRRPAT